MIRLRRHVRRRAEHRHERVDGIAAHVQNRRVAELWVKGVDALLPGAHAVIAGGILGEFRRHAAERPDLGQSIPDDGQRVVKDQPHGLEIDHAVFLRRLDERLGLRRRQDARLFQQHVLAVPQQAQGLFKVAAVRAGDVGRVERIRRGKGLQIGIDGIQMILLRKRPARLRRSGIDRRRAQLRHLLHRRQQPVDDKIPPDDPHANGHSVPSIDAHPSGSAGRMLFLLFN